MAKKGTKGKAVADPKPEAAAVDHEGEAMSGFRPTTGIALVLLTLLALCGVASASDWTVGEKTLLYIRIDFADLQGPPVKDADIARVLKSVDQYFRYNSYGKYNLTSTPTPTLRMPHPASFYQGNPDDQAIIRDARAAATKAGFDTDRYTLDIVAFRTRDGATSELAAIGGKGIRILNNFRNGITIHAIGHNLGLGHTRFWRTEDGSVLGIDGAGAADEYGDPYDPMGAGGTDNASPNHLIARAKAALGWLGGEGVREVRTSGTYRLYAHDLPGPGMRALRMQPDPKTEYWVEFRQLIIDNPLLMNGVRLHRVRSEAATVDLLNMNPGSPRGAADAALVLGHTFADTAAGIYLTPIALHPTTPPSIDLVINLGTPPAPAPGRGPLTLDVKASSTIAALGAPVQFTATIANPGKTPLVCAWDFGDGTFATGETVTHAWKTGSRDYVVRATATDLWGREASRILVVSVGRPVYGMRIVGSIIDAPATNGAGLGGVRVNVTPDRPAKTVRYGQETTLSDSDGKWTVPGLTPGVYTIRAIRQGYSILPVKQKFPAARPLTFAAMPLDPHQRAMLLKDAPTLRVRATIDGTDELRLTRKSATWKHLTWDWPTNITLNDIPMNPRAPLANTGATRFLKATPDWAGAVLAKKSGRGAVDLFRDGDCLVITFDDSEGGTGEYDLEIALIDIPGARILGRDFRMKNGDGVRF
jgi:hypothetical protein